MEKKESIVFKNASLGYKKNNQDTCVLKEINLSFYQGDFVGIVGLNGIGKSTLLKSLCGLLPLLSGEILINQKSISSYNLNELAKKIAIVLTEKIGGFNLTSYDVVAAGQMPYTNSFNKLHSKNLEIIEAAINACDLKNHEHKLLNELSDGLFQKTIIAKALAQETPIMLLDEPSAFLDYSSKHNLFLLLKKLATDQNKCVLVSSHDLDLLLKYCSKLLVISNSGIELIPVSEAKTNKVFQEMGGGFI
ncbi:MAG: ABC transporter ATP-binding protein [Bacteroidota bacterium]|nr:ABC transporter ATP-binding protein [Bacteroidota bacterium]MDP3146264.1 ABC transporter ATP-binding protein [Bacteroidota bacterium]